MNDLRRFFCVDTAAWPLICITYPVVPTLDSVAQFVRDIDKVMAQATRQGVHCRRRRRLDPCASNGGDRRAARRFGCGAGVS